MITKKMIDFPGNIQLNLNYSEVEIDFKQLEQNVRENCEKMGFPNSAHLVYKNDHYFWLG